MYKIRPLISVSQCFYKKKRVFVDLWLLHLLPRKCWLTFWSILFVI